MSPQSRATTTQTATTFASNDDGGSGNLCSGASSVADLTMAANLEYALHKIESDSSATPANPLALQLQDTTTGDANTLTRKRSCVRISLSPKSQQPFLSSYGSAFLSGIFADIAQASDDDQIQHGSVAAQYGAVLADATDNGSGDDPCHKKARTTSSTSHVTLAEPAEGAVVSPRPNAPSTLKIQGFNDQVRELQDMAFPSLPHIPITISSSSCSSVSWQAMAPRPAARGEETKEDNPDSPSYGWFVSTDDDDGTDTADQIEPSAAHTFLPGTKPDDLAFKAITAPEAGDQDLVVQQALAADTIDDVLGDLF